VSLIFASRSPTSRPRRAATRSPTSPRPRGRRRSTPGARIARVRGSPSSGAEPPRQARASTSEPDQQIRRLQASREPDPPGPLHFRPQLIPGSHLEPQQIHPQMETRRQDRQSRPPDRHHTSSQTSRPASKQASNPTHTREPTRQSPLTRYRRFEVDKRHRRGDRDGDFVHRSEQPPERVDALKRFEVDRLSRYVACVCSRVRL
jgi:hypothetical protein